MKTSHQAAKTTVSLIQCHQLPIYEQLQLEEALLRADNRNWCLINHGTTPAIVMGISGKPELLIDNEIMAKKPVPLIRRFSGGGTVYVDDGTHFVTWIFNAPDIAVDCCPAKVHRWSIEFYQAALPTVHIDLKENDYVIGEKKWGGNAQYLCKGRWLHHSSILWDYDEGEMRRLLLPQKKPAYRQERSHADFLCRLKDHLPSRAVLEERLLSEIYGRFNIIPVSLDAAQSLLPLPHRKSVHKL